MKRILCIIPTNGFLNPQCVKSWYDIKVPEGYEMDIDYAVGYSVAQARNRAARQALTEEYEYLLMIDSDNIAPPNTLEILVKADSDIAHGWCLAYADSNLTCVLHAEQNTPGYFTVYSDKDIPDGVFDIRASGMACTLVKTHVFKAMKHPYFVFTEYEMWGELGEDYYFQFNATKLGFRNVCCKELQLGHVKTTLI